MVPEEILGISKKVTWVLEVVVGDLGKASGILKKVLGVLEEVLRSMEIFYGLLTRVCGSLKRFLVTSAEVSLVLEKVPVFLSRGP